MSLIHSFEKSGNLLFKYRGQIPVVLFLMAIPVVYFTDYQSLRMSSFAHFSLLIICLLISVIGQIIRSIAIGTSNKHTSGRNRDNQVAEVLNTKGIYSIVRHPLYLGNFFMWMGIVLFTFNIWYAIVVSLLFLIYYERIMFAEEQFLAKKFGNDFIDWSLKVPAFWPKGKLYQKSEISFSLKTVLRREYPGIAAAILGFWFVDILRNYFEDFVLDWSTNYTIIFFWIFGGAFLMRTLKHHSKLLFEEDRS